MRIPETEDLRIQLERLYSYSRFRGLKLRRLLGFLVEEWLRDGGKQLSEKYIGEELKDEPATLEPDTGKWGYPRTRANLGHVRKRLRSYYETVGYRDRIIIKLNPGSYAPVIAYNPISTAIPDLDPSVENLILRAKTALDCRTFRGASQALDYAGRIPVNFDNPRQGANAMFLVMATACFVPTITLFVRQQVEPVLARIRKSGFEPWESIFTEACCEACYQHRWQKALELFELAITNSQGEARYYWWYTALLATLERLPESIGILDSAVRHFSRTNLAARTDLALLQTMAGRFDDAEETLSASLDFTSSFNTHLCYSFAVLYEAQDRLDEAARWISNWLYYAMESKVSNNDDYARGKDGHALINGMFALIAGRLGRLDAASAWVEGLLKSKSTFSGSPTLDIALALIGTGRLEEAVMWLRKAAFVESDPFAMWFHIFPPLRHLYSENSFRDLLKELGLSAQRMR